MDEVRLGKRRSFAEESIDRGGLMRNFLKLMLGLSGFVALLGGAAPVGATPAMATRTRIVEAYGRLPLTFEANAGQLDPAVRFVSRGQAMTLYLTPAEAVLSLYGAPHTPAVVRMRLVGARRDASVAGEDPLPTQSNYFLGSDPRRWRTGVPHFGRVRASGVYPGIDLVYRGNRRRLEYDFVIAPGTDPRRVRLAFSGAESIAIGARGELILRTAAGDLVQPPPAVYQGAGQRRRRVAGRYLLLAQSAAAAPAAGASAEVGFALGAYDPTEPLTIDPVLGYSTYLGGSLGEFANAIAVDAAGNAYVTGATNSPTFPGVNGSSLQPTKNGDFDAYVTKINPGGTAIVYSTFLGGSQLDEGNAIAIDGTGNVYLAGNTDSTDFPGVTAASIQPANAGNGDGFVTKIDAAGGTILYSTYLGGPGIDACKAIAVDGLRNAIVTGSTQSTSFPGVTASSIQPAYGGGGIDGFVTKINPLGTAIVYSTFLGGAGEDLGFGVSADTLGNAYVAGQTNSATFPGVGAGSIQPASGGGGDGFVTKIDPLGTGIVYSTFLGGSNFDRCFAIAIDGTGNAYVTGESNSATFPGVGAGSIQPANAGNGDAFVTKIDPAGTAILYSTFLGGLGRDLGAGIAVDGAGNAWVTGSTQSLIFPGVDASSIQPTYGGGFSDAFVTKINAAGTAIGYSTFLGGGDLDGGTGIGVDGSGNAYVMGLTDSANFPGVNQSSIQPTYAGGGDAFVTMIDAAAGPAVIPTLAPWGLIALALLLAVSGLARTGKQPR
jgi:hypothetical protein